MGATVKGTKQSGNQALGLWFWFLILVAAVTITAIGVVYASHKNRHLLNELQQLEKQRNALQVEWGQLLLEQSSMVSQGRIEEMAITELGMEVPVMEDIVVVKVD